MLVEFPFTTAPKVANDFRPMQKVSTKSALRSLRDKDAVSTGVPGRPRAAGGRLAGEMRWYCSLNRDAARAARRGEWDLARAFAAKASEVEGEEAAREVFRSLQSSDAAGTSEMPSLAAVFLSVQIRDHLHEAVSEVVSQTQDARQSIGGVTEDRSMLFGRVASLRDGLVEVDVENETTRLTLPAQNIDAGLRDVGSAMAVLWENCGDGQALVSTLPAFDLDDADVDAAGFTITVRSLDDSHGLVIYPHDARGARGAIYPYDLPEPEERERVELPASVLDGEPTIRRPRRIHIGLSQ